MSTDLISRRQQVQILRQLPKDAGAHGARHRCQRGTGRFDSVRPLQFAPAEGPVDGLL